MFMALLEGPTLINSSSGNPGCRRKTGRLAGRQFTTQMVLSSHFFESGTNVRSEIPAQVRPDQHPEMKQKFIFVGKPIGFYAFDGTIVANANEQVSSGRIEEGSDGLQTGSFNGRVGFSGSDVPSKGRFELASSLLRPL